MRCIILLSGLLATVYAQDSCFVNTMRWCADKEEELRYCNVDYGHMRHIDDKLQQYVSLHINTSYNYLLMSTDFGGYMNNNEGIEKVLRHLSDSTWEDAIELITFMNKRGLQVKFLSLDDSAETKVVIPGPSNEIITLGHALDYQKLTAKKAIEIHSAATVPNKYDPEVASFLENRFLHRHADVIRNLAGLVHDLKLFANQANIASLSVFLFDEYLKKVSM